MYGGMYPCNIHYSIKILFNLYMVSELHHSHESWSVTLPSVIASRNTGQSQIETAIHLTTKLMTTNFPVWRKHVESTLSRLELEIIIIRDSIQHPKQIDDKEGKKSNPEYISWYRKDQMVMSTILGSFSNQIKLLFCSATTDQEAWERLSTSFASSSRSHVISLKSKLVKRRSHDSRALVTWRWIQYHSCCNQSLW